MATVGSRRTLLLLASLALLYCPHLWADVAQKTVDKRNADEVGEYAIGFAAKESDGGYDHAFVIWYYSDPKGHRTVRRGAGFYPVASENTHAYDVVFGITGEVANDSKVKISQQLTVLVNKDIFDAALAVESKYKNGNTYRLGFEDCTTFVMQVARTIPGLTVPSRLTNLYPASFISSLYDKN